MDSKSISELSARLLELERRFDAFRSLQDDELRDIKSILVQLREDTMALARTNPTVPFSNTNDKTFSPDDTEGDSADDLPIMAL